MNPEPLFIQRCEQIAQLLTSQNEVELLDLGARLRQLFVDQHSLAETVNKNKLKFQFSVNPIRIHPDLPPPSIYQLEDGLDPDTSPPGRTPITVDLEGFLKHQIAIFQGKPITVRDTIKFAADVAGGVHHDPAPKSKYETNASAAKSLELGGFPAGVRQLKAIGRVAMKAMGPLIADVKKRL